jgi:hypothetical protein
VVATPTAAGQYAIDNFLFGGQPPGPYQNNITIENTTVIPATTNVQDVSTGGIGSFIGGAYALVEDSNVSGVDGIQFGIDTLPGVQITFTGQVTAPGVIPTNTPGSGQSVTPTTIRQMFDSWDAFAAAWNNPIVRLTSGKASQLVLWYPGSQDIRTCWGRGRQITPVLGETSRGVKKYVATFQAADPYFYSLTPSSIIIQPPPQSPPLNGTPPPPAVGKKSTPAVVTPARIPVPIGPPIPPGTDRGTANNLGALPTWPVITMTGACTNPVLTQVATGKWIGYNGTLRRTDQLVIDTRPWVRTVTLNGKGIGTNRTGTAALSDLVLPGGQTTFTFHGSTSDVYCSCRIQWWIAHTSIAGSIPTGNSPLL